MFQSFISRGFDPARPLENKETTLQLIKQEGTKELRNYFIK
jgi:hypothetical protein